MHETPLGMMTYSFHRMISDGRLDVPGVVRFCAEIGVPLVDITEAHWRDPERDLPATVAAMAETGVAVACCNTSLDLITRGPRAKAEREQRLRQIFDRLARVECPVVMLGSVTGDLAPADWRREFGVGLAEALPMAEDYGVTVTFENRGGPAGLLVGTAEHCLEIMRHAADPRLRFTFDVGNFRYVDRDPNAAFGPLAEAIAHVHLKDVVPSGDSFQMVPLGAGEVDNVTTIRKLVERRFAGCIAIESGGRGADLDDARQSVDAVKHLLTSD